MTPYDEVIDSGLRDYREAVNRFVKDMEDSAGTVAGTYEENKTRYNEFEAKIDLLIDRSQLGSSGRACRLSNALTDRIVALLPGVAAEVAADKQPSNGDAAGCTHRMLELVRQNLDLLEEIHRDADKCGPKRLSCIRPATAKDAVSITNQAIDAAWIVEMAKREGDAD